LSYDDDLLNDIYNKTKGCCRYCDKKLAWKNYGVSGARAAWEVDHATPLSRGGTDYRRNLWPVCMDCNREKSDRTHSEYLRYLERQDR